jgi:hypothetical protein
MRFLMKFTSIANIFKCLRAHIHAYTTIKRAEQPLNNRLKPRGGRKRAEFDVVRAMRLRRDGFSDRRIARTLCGVVSANTISARLNELETAAPVAPPVPASPQPMSAPKPAPEPVPLSIAPIAPPDPYDNAQDIRARVVFAHVSIELNPREFFLVSGKENARVAASYGLRAIGIDCWHHEYMQLPIFQCVEKLLVVLGSSHVHTVCKRRILFERERQYPILSEDFRRSDDKFFEDAHHFQKFPLPSHHDKLGALITCDEDRAVIRSISEDIWIRERCLVSAACTPSPEKPSVFGGGFGEVEQWRWRWSGAS